MNISPIVWLLLLAIAFLAGIYRRSLVLPFWIIALLVFPTARAFSWDAELFRVLACLQSRLEAEK